jgi:hypothetical protein
MIKLTLEGQNLLVSTPHIVANTVDTAVTQGSDNPVSSDAVYTAIQALRTELGI